MCVEVEISKMLQGESFIGEIQLLADRLQEYDLGISSIEDWYEGSAAARWQGSLRYIHEDKALSIDLNAPEVFMLMRLANVFKLARSVKDKPVDIYERKHVNILSRSGPKLVVLEILLVCRAISEGFSHEAPAILCEWTPKDK